MALRSILQIVTADRVQVAPGFFVRRPLPSADIDYVDPWLMLDHFGPINIAPGEAKGVPDHPHRGFEPITYLIDGAIEHRDSAGNHVVVRAGEVNWMTAGSGIVHSEMPPDDVLNNGGRSHGFQIWLNLPRINKMTTPRIQRLTADQIPIVVIGDATVKIIAGEMSGIMSPIRTHSPVLFVHVSIPAGTKVEVPVDEGFNFFAYVATGEGWIGENQPIESGQMALFGDEGHRVAIGAVGTEPLEVLILGGVALNEPVFSYGPFVMNTKQEIIDAVDDYQSGKMGA